MTVCAEAGWAATRKALASDVITKPRRDQLMRGSMPSHSGAKRSIALLPAFVDGRGKIGGWGASAEASLLVGGAASPALPRFRSRHHPPLQPPDLGRQLAVG